MPVRAIRGATTVGNNSSAEILEATRELLEEMQKRNALAAEDIISVIFTVTGDLDAAYPAVAARQLGWTSTALLCMNEMYVPGSLGKCIRIMLHINTDKGQSDIEHVYLKGARILRPDLADEL